jgi:MFS-type transporter involved in bile tolerance (Atg22 family)
MIYLPSGARVTIDLPFMEPVVAPVAVVVATMMMGVAFSLIPAVMWPAVAYIVEQGRLGTGYALMTFIQQIGVALFPWLIGKTFDLAGASAANPAGYIPGMWIFTALSFVGLFFSYKLWRTEIGPQAHGLETIRA